MSVTLWHWPQCRGHQGHYAHRVMDMDVTCIWGSAVELWEGTARTWVGRPEWDLGRSRCGCDTDVMWCHLGVVQQEGHSP